MTSVLVPDLNSASHPYYPVSQNFPGYEPPAVTLLFLLGTFFAGVAVLLVTAWCITGMNELCWFGEMLLRPGWSLCWSAGRLASCERLTFCWFALCGVIHFIVEGQ